MGTSLWRRDDGSLPFLRFPFHGAGCVWQAVSRRYQEPSFQSGQPPVLRSGYGGRGCTCVSTGKDRTRRIGCVSPNRGMGSSLCLTLDGKREELNVDFFLSIESLEA